MNLSLLSPYNLTSLILSSIGRNLPPAPAEFYLYSQQQVYNQSKRVF
jgi:hypothetical protein